MADPFSWVAIGSTVAGSIAGGAGALQSGSAKAGMYTYQSGVAAANQKIALANADYVREAGEKEALSYGMKARFQQGKIVATQGASGLDVNSGSAQDVQAGQRTVTGMDLATIRENAARKAYGYDVEASKYGAESGAYTMAASDAKSAGRLGAITSLLSGVSSVASKWTQGQSVGLFGAGGAGGGDPMTSAYYS